jgi:hypothetical protein
MIISKITTDNFTYFNLHAEEVITSNFIEENNIGIYGDRLQISTVERIIDFIKAESTTPKNLVFDFKYINACQPNLNKSIISIKDDGFRILLINIHEYLCKDLAFNSLQNKNNKLVDNTFIKFYLFEDTADAFTSIEINTPLLFETEFRKKIKEFIYPYDKPHTSSLVYLTSYVDTKKFMSFEKEFMLFSIYKLANRIKKEWPDEIKKEPILICQSMNSSYVVSILSTLLKLDILILDKIGPVNKLYNRLDNNISDKRKYIVVSDLVCLGTEVKIVKNLIQFIGGKCLGNVSLIKTETLKKSDISKDNATIAVFSIKRENNKELNYNITTDLEPLTDE